MMLGIGIEQTPDHALVLRVVLLRLALEKLHAALAERDRDLDPFIPENQVLRVRQEVRDDLWVAEGLVRVPDSLAHRFVFLCARSSAMTRRESAKASCATAKATPCFSWFSWSLRGSHSNRAFAIGRDYH